MATLQDFRIKVVVIDGPSREEMFDANRLTELELKCEFTLLVTDESGQLRFVDFLGKPSPLNRGKIKLEAEILSCEPRSTDGTEWMVKLVIPVKKTKIERNSTSFFTELVQTRIIFNTDNRQGEPHDRKFVEKFMSYNDRTDENNPNGLWFMGYIARMPEVLASAQPVADNPGRPYPRWSGSKF